MNTNFENIWSTPKLAPMYPTFPIKYRNVEIITTVYRTDRKAIEAHIEPPLLSTSDLVMMHNYYMPDVDVMGEVEETNVMVGVQLSINGEIHHGGFSTNLLISSEIGLAQGREIHGQPKKLGNTKFLKTEDGLTAEVSRGKDLISRVVMRDRSSISEVSEIERYFPFRKNINHKVIRNIDGTQGINQITSRTLADVSVKECWKGPSTLKLFENKEAPFHLLPVVETIESFYWKADFSLVPGVILYDYLKENQ